MTVEGLREGVAPSPERVEPRYHNQVRACRLTFLTPKGFEVKNPTMEETERVRCRYPDDSHQVIHLFRLRVT